MKISRREGVRIALSGFIAFHLFAVTLAPNSQSYLGTQVSGIIEPYIHVLELSNSWSFFAPDPGPPPVFLDFEIYDGKGASLQRGKWPDHPDPFVLRERQNRRVASAEFMVSSEVRTEKMMVPYLCSRAKGAHSVTLWRTWLPTPSIWEVREGKASLSGEEGLKNLQRELISHNFCEGQST